MAYIKTVGLDSAVRLLKKIYDAAIARAGRIYNIVRLMSVNPRTLQASMNMYTSILHAPSPLSRAQREMIAAVVSRDNNCFY